MYASHLWTLFLVFAIGLYAAPSDNLYGALSKRAVPIRPSDDPFYQGPPGFEQKTPGTILRYRPVPAPLIVPNNGTLRVKAAWQVLYRTTDSVGQPQAAMTTILIPEKPNYQKMLSYQVAYDSSYVNCGPSYTLQQGSDMSNGSTTGALEILFIKAALDQGWVVNTPDYEGPKAAYVAGVQAGQATLDSVRAALKSGSFTGISSKASYAMWGYSGGCLASGWASELQPSYAKELNFVGAACGGAVPNVTSAIYSINGTAFAGLGVPGTMGLAQAYQNLSTFIDANLVPETAAKFKSVLTMCESNDVAAFQNEDLFKYFKNGEASLNEPIPRSVLSIAGQQGLRDVPTMPLYYYKAAGDEISPAKDMDALYDKLCAKGANIRCARDAIGNHGYEAILGAPGAFGWIKNRLDGIPAPKGCSKDPFNFSELSLEAIEVFGPFLFSVLLGELGDPNFFPG